MSDYTPVNNYTAKDNLSTGDPDKLILGADIDSETAAIQTAIATKLDSDDLSSQAQAEAGTDNTTLMTPLRMEQHQNVWADENGGMIGSMHELTDPNADELIGWDDSAGGAGHLVPTEGVQVDTTNVKLDINGLTEDTDPDTSLDYYAVYDADGADHKQNKLRLGGLVYDKNRAEVKGATESVSSSTTLQDDDHLVFTDLPDGFYILKVFLYYDGSNSADLKVNWTGGTVQGMWTTVEHFGDDAEYRKEQTAGTPAYLECQSGYAITYAEGTFYLNNVGTNTVKFQFAQQSSNSNPTRVYATYSGAHLERLSASV